MKKLLLSIAMIAVGFTASAQGFEKSDVYLTGTVGFNNESLGDFSSSLFTFSPSAGYFVSENIALELGLTFASGENEATDTEASVFGVGLGASYFFTPSEKFSFIVGAGFSYSNESSEEFGVEQPDQSIFGFTVSPGINYFISESFALRASIGALSYRNTSVDIDGADSINNFGLNLNLSNIELGLTYKF
ncbi:porin family protein [Tenacibaculum geojense]|uniref:Porin family protein n=1 Tax=Tenacibaculum geojense TaxID=915352 RepID=A0ABW3JPF3_9FLAO